MNIEATLDSPVTAIGDDAAILGEITATQTHLAVWQRPRPAALAWVDALEWDAIDDLDFPAAIDALEVEIIEGLAEAGYPCDQRSLALRDEIGALARRFAAIMDCDRVRLRLEIVETDACRKFHADAVAARLLTTLSGPGTQWIEVATPDRITQLDPGDVALFKGRLRVREPAILHRSPPIAGTGDRRLLLVIDPCDPMQETVRA